MVKKGEVEKALNYIQRFNVNLNDSQDHLGNTALSLAAQTGDKRMCQMLLEKGADQSVINNIGRSPEDYAYEFDNTDCIEIFESIEYSNNKMPKVEFTTIEREEKK
jgi:ankyrin repeat protein